MENDKELMTALMLVEKYEKGIKQYGIVNRNKMIGRLIDYRRTGVGIYKGKFIPISLYRMAKKIIKTAVKNEIN